MCQVSAPLDKVAQYYADQMTAAGWTPGDKTSLAGVVTQPWQKGDVTVMVVLTFQNNLTQIIISPQ